MNELSDKNESKKLEDLFREGMNEAEVAPSDRLWGRIEQGLDLHNAGLYRRRMVWAQRLAAACVLLVMLSAGYLFYDWQKVHQGSLATIEMADKADGPLATNEIRTGRAGQLPTGTRPVSAQKNGERKTVRERAGGNAQSHKNGETLAQLQKKLPASATGARQAGNSPESAPIAVSGTSVGRRLTQGPGNPAPLALAVPQKSGRRASGSAALSSPESRRVAPGDQAATMLASVLPPRQTQVGSTTLDSLLISDKWPELGPGAPVLAPLTLTAVAEAPNLGLLPVELQDLKEKKKETGTAGSRWRLGGKYAAQYFDQNISLAGNSHALANGVSYFSNYVPAATAGSSSYAEALREFDLKTSSGYSYNTGLSAGYELTDRWSLETGIDYTSNVAVTNTSYIFNNAQLATRYNRENFSADMTNKNAAAAGLPTTAFLATLAGGSNLNQSPVIRTPAFETHYRYRLLGLPVKVNYQTGRKKSFYFASAGFISHLLMQAQILTNSPRVSDLEFAAGNEETPFRKWQFAALATAGRGFQISRGWQVKAGLEASRFLTGLTNKNNTSLGKQGKPYALGLSLSSSYSFGK